MKIMKRMLGRSTATSIVLVATMAVGTASLAAVPESTDPIKIVTNNWASQLVDAHVAGQLLTRMGYSVKYVPSNMQLQFTAMANGDVHLQTEVWEGTAKEPFMKQVKAGRVIDAGTHRATTREEWWYPAYVEEKCPGLPSWKALNKCAELFATPITSPKGRYLAGPVDWEKPDQKKIDALGLNFVVQNAGQAASLWAELDAAYRRKEPIILFNWSPNWTMAEYEGHFVEFPDYEPACTSNPEWGINPEATYDCGNPEGAWLKKAVWAGFPEKWSCGYELIENIDFTTEMLSDMAALMAVEQLKPSQAAKQWVAGHKDVWQQWMPACAKS